MNTSNPAKVGFSFESLRIWHDARRLTSSIYGVTGGSGFTGDYSFRDQIRRATVSVMSNIAEGFERGGARQFHQFLMIAKGSIGEVRSLLFAAEDLRFIDDISARQLREEARVLARRIMALANKVRGSTRT